MNKRTETVTTTWETMGTLALASRGWTWGRRLVRTTVVTVGGRHVETRIVTVTEVQS